MTPIAYESITVANAAIGFTPAKLANASYAFAQLETAPIRYTSDGTAPTSAVGTLMVAGLGLDVCGPEALKAFRAIRTTGNSGTLTVTYYKAGY
jgi:hypothetical protein